MDYYVYATNPGITLDAALKHGWHAFTVRKTAESAIDTGKKLKALLPAANIFVVDHDRFTDANVLIWDDSMAETNGAA